jgi:hypothetical protein
MAISPKLPTINQILTLAIALAVISFVVKLLPTNVQNLFRV